MTLRLFVRATVLWALLLLLPPAMQAQQQATWQEFVEDYAADLQSNATQADDIAQQLDELEQLHRNPINLNTATREQLARIPFLTQRQAEDVTKYLDAHRPLLSAGELQLVRSLDVRTLRWLLLFVTVGPEQTATGGAWARGLWAGRHEVLGRLGIPLYRREGFRRNSTLSNSAHYLGDRYAARLRYQYNAGDTLRYGLQATKDAGEPFASRGNALFDDYSFYASYRPGGHWPQVVVGDYYVHWGEGLVMGSGSLFSGPANYQPSDASTLKPHTSASSGDYLRGAAVAGRWGAIAWSAFGSITRPDAVVRGDSVITSLPTSGLHRTAGEMDHRRAATRLAGGADVAWTTRNFTLGANFMATRLDKPLAPTARPYNRYALRGRSTHAAGLHGRWALGRVRLQGEWARSQGGGASHIATIAWQPARTLRLVASERGYSKRYHAPWGHALSAGSRVQNEQGAYLATRWALLKPLVLDGFVDWCYRPWATYTYPSSSHALRGRAGATYSAARGTLLGYWQFVKNSYRRDGRSLQHTRHNGRLAWSRKWGRHSLTAEGRLAIASRQGEQHQGWATALRWGVRPAKHWQLSGLAAYFDAPDYDARIMLYEPNVAYASSSLSLYGRGLRFSLTTTGALGRWGELAARYSITHRTDHKGFGTGADRIDRNDKQDVVVQARLFF